MKQIIPFKKEITFKTMISKITSISLEHTLVLQEDDTVAGDFIVSGSYKMTEASQIDEEFSYKVPIEITIDSKYDTSNITLDIDDFVYEVLDEERLLLKIDLCIDKLELKTVTDEKEENIISSYDEYEELDNTLKEIEEAKEEELVRNDNDNNKDDLFLDTSKEEKLEIPININSINSNNITPNNNFDHDNNIETLPYYPQSNNNTVTPIDNEQNSVTSIFSAFKDTDETFSTYSIYIIREGDTLEDVLNKYKTTREILSEYNDFEEIRIGSKIIIPSSVNNE